MALDSYSFGLRLYYGGNEWQIGVIFITEPQAASVEIGRLFEHATDSQRSQILAFKQLLLDRGKDVSSAFVYRAVLERGITGQAQLYDYLRTLGYEL